MKAVAYKSWLFVTMVLLAMLALTSQTRAQDSASSDTASNNTVNNTVSSDSASSDSLNDVSSEELFSRGVKALEQENYDRAIQLYETLADRGFDHPNASYNRGLAYLGRVRTKQEKSGDLGRSAAGFEDALLVRPSDTDAARALELVRTEVLSRLSRSKAPQPSDEQSFDRIFVNAASESTWAWLALISSVLFSMGLIFRKSKSPAFQLTGVIQIPITLLALTVFGALTARAYYLRANYVPAIVVVDQARIVDDKGAALPGQTPIAQATKVDIIKRQGALAKVRYGTKTCWTHASGLRALLDRSR